jgi:site-specific DNA-methyltransferase (adenine-specific)
MYRSKIDLYNVDCLPFMKQCKDKQFDLAIVDPPYGIGIDGQKESICKNPKHNRKAHDFKGWDNSIPTDEYFRELERISKNQIVWGANYFVANLQKGTKGWIVWDKGQHGLTMSDCELAYSSFNKPTRIFTFNRGLIAQKGGSIHPTQKPVELYRYLLNEYAEEGNKIFDSHLGSGSIAIACDDLGFDLTACEIDKDYFEKANKRIEAYRSQTSIF